MFCSFLFSNVLVVLQEHLGFCLFLIENLLNNWLLWYAALMRIVFLLYANKYFLVCFNGLKGFFNNL